LLLGVLILGKLKCEIAMYEEFTGESIVPESLGEIPSSIEVIENCSHNYIYSQHGKESGDESN